MTDLLDQEEDAVYADWKRYGHHLKEYGAEFIGTWFAVFCVVGVISALFGTGSPIPHWLPSTRARLYMAGLLLGGVGWLVAVSPPGKLSGAHNNPAVSLGFWVLGKMHTRDLAGYIVGQMLGGGLGGVLGGAVFGKLARSVHDATLKPGSGVESIPAILAEIGTTYALTLVIFTCVSHRPLIRWTPALAMVMVSLMVGVDGSYSGCGMNPARWFGPALATWFWSLFWVYVFGPLLGAVLASGLRRTGLLTHAMPHTGKLFHDRSYRSVFLHDRLPTTAPNSTAPNSLDSSL